MNEFEANQKIVAQQQCLAAPNPYEPPFAPPSRTGWQTPMPTTSAVAASALSTASSTQVAVASVDSVVPLMLPLPYSETS